LVATDHCKKIFCGAGDCPNLTNLTDVLASLNLLLLVDLSIKIALNIDLNIVEHLYTALDSMQCLEEFALISLTSNTS
jgi:hypothetical protein